MSTLYQSRQLAGLFWLLGLLLGALPVVGIIQAPSLFGLPNLREEVAVGANDSSHIGFGRDSYEGSCHQLPNAID